MMNIVLNIVANGIQFPLIVKRNVLIHFLGVESFQSLITFGLYIIIQCMYMYDVELLV